MATFEVTGRTGTTITIPIGRGKTFEVKLVDGAGRALRAVPVRFHVGEAAVDVDTDGQGVAKLCGQTVDAAQASIGDLEALREATAVAAAGAPEAVPAGAVERELDAFELVDLRAGAPAAVVVRTGLRCLDVPGPHFDFDRSFIRPDGMGTLPKIVAELEAPERRAMLFGHSDTVGDDAYNKALSERRARAVYAALTHDAAAWEQLRAAEGPWSVKATQVMLNAVNDGSQPKTPEDGTLPAAYHEAVKAFQRRVKLKDDGDAGPNTRRELFLAYFRKFVPAPVSPERFALFGKSPFMGCGEFNPFSEGAADELSRRVVALVFDPAAEPQGLPCKVGDLAPCRANLLAAPPAEPEGMRHFRCKVFRELSTRCPCGKGGAGSDEMIITFADEITGAPYKGREVLIEHPDGTRVVHQTNNEGKVVISSAKDGGYKILEIMSMPAGPRCRVK